MILKLCLVEILSFKFIGDADCWCLVEKLILKSRFWRWNLIKICVWNCDTTSRSYFGKMKSTLGSVVPLAMLYIGNTVVNHSLRIARWCKWLILVTKHIYQNGRRASWVVRLSDKKRKHQNHNWHQSIICRFLLPLSESKLGVNTQRVFTPGLNSLSELINANTRKRQQ